MYQYKVGICGFGWVGKAVNKLFPNASVYIRGMNKGLVNSQDIAFICIPTPSFNEGILDTSAVEEIISWCKTDLIVIRSTINPGDCDRWTKKYGKRIVFQPEYIGETPNHPMFDPKTRQFLILGGKRQDTRQLIELYTTVYNANITIRQVTAYEAEVIKLTENRAIAFKVMQCQELYQVCEKAKIDYYTIRDLVYGDDLRFNLWFSFIYPNKLGFHNSKCLGKDVSAWNAWAESVGFDPSITKLLVEKSKEYDNSVGGNS